MNHQQGRELDDDIVAALEGYLDWEMGDGLPVIPPTPARLSAMLQAMGLEAGEVIGVMPPGNGEARAEHVAANALLAGCGTVHGPIVLAAVRAMLDDRFTLAGVACSTKGCAPLVIVNGPIRHEAAVRCKGNVFGHGTRANATIGRAVRLIVQNVGRAHPDELDRATLGHPGKYAYCIGEDEEASPWPPLHAQRGMAIDESAVTVVGTEGPRLVNVHTDDADAVLAAIADTIATVGIFNDANVTARSPHVVVLATEHRTLLAEAGWDKATIASYVCERAVIDADTMARVGSPANDARVIADPADVLIVAAGGAAGRFSCVAPGWSWMSQPVTRRVAG